MITSCYQAIRQSYSVLTSTEQKVADYITANGEKVVMMSIGELAEQAGVVKSAVVRCCQSLGFEGYRQMKIVLSAELSKNAQLNYTPYIYRYDDNTAVMDKVFAANVKAIHDIATQIDRKVIEKVLGIIRKAKNIYIYGVGTSISIVNELQYRLMHLGYSAVAYTDNSMMKISTLNISEEDAVIGISYSGRTIAVIETLQLAVQSGAETICITSHPNSQLTKVSKHSIIVSCDEIHYPVEAMSAQIAQLCLIYAMTTALSVMDYDETVRRAKRSRELLDTVRMEAE